MMHFPPAKILDAVSPDVVDVGQLIDPADWKVERKKG
jgi:hypothetical protein